MEHRDRAMSEFKKKAQDLYLRSVSYAGPGSSGVGALGKVEEHGTIGAGAHHGHPETPDPSDFTGSRESLHQNSNPPSPSTDWNPESPSVISPLSDPGARLFPPCATGGPLGLHTSSSRGSSGDASLGTSVSMGTGPRLNRETSRFFVSRKDNERRTTLINIINNFHNEACPPPHPRPTFESCPPFADPGYVVQHGGEGHPQHAPQQGPLPHSLQGKGKGADGVCDWQEVLSVTLEGMREFVRDKDSAGLRRAVATVKSEFQSDAAVLAQLHLALFSFQVTTAFFQLHHSAADRRWCH